MSGIRTPIRRNVAAIAAAVLGVYVLIIAGATASVVDAVSVCSTWPTCQGHVFTFDDPRLLVAWGHRLLALVVGGLVLVAGILGWRATDRRRVKGTLAIAVLGYPVQVGLGAAVAGSGATGPAPVIHLLAGMTIFVSLVLALAWTLEPDTTDEDSTRVTPVASVEPADTAHPSTFTEPTVGDLRATVRAYVSLTKPRLMWLLCLVAAAGMALTAGNDLSIGTVVATLGGGVLAIGASGTFNHVLERDIDRRMQRTSDRPLATDRVGVRNAIVFGVVLAMASIAVFLSINLLAAALGFAAIMYYSVVYTLLLKPNTVRNTVIGGLAGSFPAVIGAAAATNTIGPAALVLAGVIFLWTPAHFYNLALAYKEDYARGGFPMMPVVHGEATTRKHVLWYLGATLLASAILAAVGGLGPLYAVTTVVFGGVFLWAVLRLHAETTTRAAMRTFHASNAYLGAILIAVVVDGLAI